LFLNSIRPKKNEEDLERKSTGYLHRKTPNEDEKSMLYSYRIYSREPSFKNHPFNYFIIFFFIDKTSFFTYLERKQFQGRLAPRGGTMCEQSLLKDGANFIFFSNSNSERFN
jgi:hypothetical protein